ncbi:Conserved_hypothetical protein [Hexamita inflata]|uniref:Uncharacterized protein n=1 Tax=Hexamita inflata TaxID=28002 RepID=A0AA86PIJ0_9EUKA|nr:Conserved hypothetical protein [Hexamita inflata]
MDDDANFLQSLLAAPEQQINLQTSKSPLYRSNNDLNSLLCQSQILQSKVTRQPNEVVIHAMPDVYKLDQLDHVQEMLRQQNETRQRAMNVPTDQQLQQQRQQMLQKLEPANLSKTVGNILTQQRFEQLTGDAANLLKKTFTQNQIQILNSEYPEQDLGDLQKFEDQANDQQLVNFDELHQSQIANVSKIPVKEFEPAPFSVEDEVEFKRLGQLQLINEIMNGFSPQITAHVQNIALFKQNIENGTIPNSFNPKQIALLIGQARTTNNSNVEPDFYNNLFIQLKNKLNAFIYEKDSIEHTQDYQIVPLDIREALQQLNNENKIINPQVAIVDELAHDANLLGQAYYNEFARIETELQQRRENNLTNIMKDLNFERHMQNKNRNEQILKLQSQEGQQIHVELEMRLKEKINDQLTKSQLVKESGNQDVFIDQPETKFLLDYFIEYTTKQAETKERDRKQYCLQNIGILRTPLFQNPFETRQWTRGNCIDEDLVDLNINLGFCDDHEPLLNPILEEYIGQRLQEGPTKQSTALLECFEYLKTPLSEQIQIFDFIESHMGQSDKVVSLYQKMMEYVKNNWLTQSIVSQIKDDLGIECKVLRGVKV